MPNPLQIAPLQIWLLVLIAALMLLLGFVAYGHKRVLTDAYGKSYDGLFSAARVSAMVRWVIIFLATGFALWGVAIGWPAVVLWLLLGSAFLALVIQFAARLRGR